MSRRPPPQDHSASTNDVPTTSNITSPVNPSYPGGILRPTPASRALSEPFGGYDLPRPSSTQSNSNGNRPLRSILTNPIPPPSQPRVRFLIPQSSTEIRDRLAGREGLVDSPGSTASSTSRDGVYSDSDELEGEEGPVVEETRPPRRPSSQEPRDLSDIIGRSVRTFVRRNFDRNNNTTTSTTNIRSGEQQQERDPNRGSISSRGVQQQEDPYRTRNNGSPAQSDTSSSITSPELRRASLANTGRNSPLQRFGARSINELRGIPTRSGTGDSVVTDAKPADLSKAPPALQSSSTSSSSSQPQQLQKQPLAESGRPRPPMPTTRKSSGHDSYHGPGQADSYYYGTPAAEQEPGVYYGPPPPKMPTPPPPPAMIPPKYKPGGGSAAEFYNPDTVDPDAAIPIQEGSQYELTIVTGQQPPSQPQGLPPPPPPQSQSQGPQQPSFFGGPITAEPTSSLPGGIPETPINASAQTSFSTAHSNNPSYPPQTQVQLSYAPGAPSSTVNASGGVTVTTGTMSAIDAATLAEMAYDQSLANQRPTSTATPSQNLSNLPPLPPSTAPTYSSPYAPPPINTNVQATNLPYKPLTTMSPVPIQSPIIAAPRPQHPSNIVPAIAAAAVAGGVIGSAIHSSHSHSASISSQTSYSQSSQSYIPTAPSHQPPPPPPLATITSPTTGKPKPPPKPAKPSILSGILSGKRPSISSPTVSHSGSAVGGKILATGLAGATAAVATALAGQSTTSKPSSASSIIPQLATTSILKPSSSSSSHHGKTTAALVVGTAAITVAAAASHKKEKEKQKMANKPSVASSSSGGGDGTRIHGLKGKANYNQKSNNIRGVKLPSAMNAFDDASSSDFLVDTESGSDSSVSSHGKRRRHRSEKKAKARTRSIEDLSSSHSSMDFGGDDISGRSKGKGKSYGAVGAASATAAIAIPGVVSDMNHSDDEQSSPRERVGAHMRKKSTDSDLAFGRSLNSGGYTSDSSMYSTGRSPEAGNGFQFWAVRNRTGRRKARRVSSRDSVNSVNSALGFGDSSDESKPGSKGWLRKRESLDSNLAFGLSSASTSRRSSYASGLREKFTIEEEEEDYDNIKGRRKSAHESPSAVKEALETAAAYTAAEAARRKGHDRRPSEGIIVAPGHRIVTEEQRMADYERLDRMRTEELKRDIARQKEAARLSELENDRREKEKFDRERRERRRKEEEFAREKQWMIEEDERRGSFKRQVNPFYYYY
ncbi:hypothetical protein TWF730_008076 [Orbilia blumenaviensis]|uniref:Uncharacterized protein n=1 Tax=Orbilia blumenaviensis TaxID=1796055 RepID=A0AAV9VBG3_9PEZI